MAAQQSSVSDSLTAAFAGMLADVADDYVIRSYVSEESSAEIPFGVMVGVGSADRGCLKLAAITDKLAGIVVHQHHYAKTDELGTTGLKPKVTIGLLRRGRIWVQVEEAVTPSSNVFVRAVVAGAEVAGAFRDTADSTDCINITQCAQYLTSAGAGELALLEIDLSSFKADEAGGGD